MKTKIAVSQGPREGSEKLPPIVYGLKGIQRIFNVSKATASRYKDTILKDAVAQQGNVIVVDTKKALKMFGLPDAENVVLPSAETAEA